MGALNFMIKTKIKKVFRDFLVRSKMDTNKIDILLHDLQYQIDYNAERCGTGLVPLQQSLEISLVIVADEYMSHLLQIEHGGIKSEQDFAKLHFCIAVMTAIISGQWFADESNLFRFDLWHKHWHQINDVGVFITGMPASESPAIMELYSMVSNAYASGALFLPEDYPFDLIGEMISKEYSLASIDATKLQKKTMENTELKREYAEKFAVVARDTDINILEPQQISTSTYNECKKLADQLPELSQKIHTNFDISLKVASLSFKLGKYGFEETEDCVAHDLISNYAFLVARISAVAHLEIELYNIPFATRTEKEHNIIHEYEAMKEMLEKYLEELQVQQNNVNYDVDSIVAVHAFQLGKSCKGNVNKARQSVTQSKQAVATEPKIEEKSDFPLLGITIITLFIGLIFYYL